MISYYDLVVFLDTISKEKRDEAIVNKLNNLEVKLEGERYFRFLDHLSLLIQDRLNNSCKELINKQDEIGDNFDVFSNQFSEYADEVSLCFKIASINIVHEENKIELGRTIMETNNLILDKIKQCFNTSNASILNLIDETYLVEK